MGLFAAAIATAPASARIADSGSGEESDFTEIDAAFAWVGEAFAEDLALARLRAESRHANGDEPAEARDGTAQPPARVA